MYIFLEFPLSVSAEEPVNFTYNEQVIMIIQTAYGLVANWQCLYKLSRDEWGLF